MSKLAVFPASGSLGSSIVNHLLEYMDPNRLVLIARNPSKIPSKWVDAGVTTRKADYNATETLDHAFDDVSHLLLISYPSIEYEHRFEVHKAAITAARNSSPGVSHIFYTSLAFGGDGNLTSAAHVMQAHLATEKYLHTLVSSRSQDDVKPFSFTAIRERIYSESWPMYAGFFDLKNPSDEIRIPHDGSGPGIAFAKIDELGEATARLVHDYCNEVPGAVSRYENKTVLLSASKAWSVVEIANLLGKLVRKEISVKHISEEEYIGDPVVQKKLASHGPSEVPKQWATSFEAIRRGETAVVTGELEKLLGRRPEHIETTLKSMTSS